MSADNWAICPRCKLRHQKAAERLRELANAAYGKVGYEDWKLKDAEANSAAEPFDKYTFREDYEIGGAEEGVVYVKYSGGCNECGLSISFDHENRIEGIEP